MKKHLFPLILIILSAAVWLAVYSRLPAQIPTHWNFSGEADDYATKLNAMISQLGIMVLIYGTMAFLPKVDPRKANYRYFSKSYAIIMNAMLAIFFLLNLLVLFNALGVSVPMSTVVPAVIGLLFIILGNYFQRVRSNFFIGIRTPWTLSSENVWKKTHRLSGKLFFAGGVVMLLAVFLPEGPQEAVIITVITVILFIPYLYSYLEFRKEKK
ncbi:SdpI family protein [Mesobacillus zeae]|uniref:SdpI family protein n=1 Tax=Mesobacillus zeae TaxID=1917180 RepID=A0A398B9M0_9BACI|nr:SdpI family protein [Mesobacillus zeae]RID84406.1 SdpI family protein [Mesobacillus zeae]